MVPRVPEDFLTPVRPFFLVVLLAFLGGAPSAVADPLHDGLDGVPMESLRDAMREWTPLAEAWFRLKAGDAAGARIEVKRLVAERPKDASGWHLLGITSAADGPWQLSRPYVVL